MLLEEGRELSASLVGAMTVVMLGVGIEDLPSVRLVPDQEVVQGLAAQGADDTFAVRVHPWGPRRGPHDLDVVGCEDRVEGLGVLRVPVAEQETQRAHPNTQLDGEVLACCTVQGPVGWAVTPAMCSRRVPCSRNTSAYTRRRSTRSMWTKSQAMMAWACAVRKSRHVGRLRRGAGSMPAAVRISQTVVEPTGRPSRTSSP